MARIPWSEIRGKYIAGNYSMRELADEFGVSLTSIGKRAKKENWKDKREQKLNKSLTSLEDKTISQEVSKISKELELIDNGIKIALENVIINLKRPVQDEYRLKVSIDSLKQLLSMSTEKRLLDKQEQTERINALRRSHNVEDKDKKIEIVISEDLKKYAD